MPERRPIDPREGALRTVMPLKLETLRIATNLPALWRSNVTAQRYLTNSLVLVAPWAPMLNPVIHWNHTSSGPISY